MTFKNLFHTLHFTRTGEAFGQDMELFYIQVKLVEQMWVKSCCV